MGRKKEGQKMDTLSSETDQKMVAVFKVLSDVNRYRMFRMLSEHPKISISEIAKSLEISLPLASQHIKILTQANLIKKERDGKKVFPKLEYNNPFVRTIVKTIQLAVTLNT